MYTDFAAVNYGEEESGMVDKRAENILDAMRGLEELIFCLKCGDLFACRYKTCPNCCELNHKYKGFSNEDQLRAEERVVTAIREFNDLLKSL